MKSNYCLSSLKWFLSKTRLLELSERSNIFQSIFHINNQRLLQKHREDNFLKLHLGCAGKFLEGWINIDAVWRPNVVVMPLPRGLNSFKNNSVGYIYTCHFLEHLQYPKEVLALLKKCYHLLRPGGVMRNAVPDIEIIIDAYTKNDKNFFKMQSQLYHPAWCTTRLEHLLYTLQQDGEHKYGYDFETLQKVMLQTGFGEVIRSAFGQSTFEALKIDYRDDDNLTLFIDAIK